MSSSPSIHFREEGNKIYSTATQRFTPALQRERLQTALNLYYKAYNTSQNPDEKSSSAKNLGMVSWRLANVSDALNEKSSVIVHFYKEAFQYISEAWLKSRDVKTNDWRDNLCTSAISFWEDMKQGRVCAIEFDKRVKVFYDILQKIEIPTVKAECYVHIATCHFHAGVTAIQEKNFKVALYQMRECYFPVTEAASCGRTIPLPHIEQEAEVLENDVLMHQCLAESMQANQIGEELFRKLLMDEEKLNIDMVYEVIDWHKQAVLQTREITEVEMEAIALSRIGKVYDKVLKLKYKAKEYLLRAMQLANSMHPRIFHGEEWFEECKAILARYQEEAVKQESEEWQKIKEKYLEELESEMKDLKQNDANHTQSDEFLKYVYEKFPPVNPENKLEGLPDSGTIARADLKKILQKAVVHYHPDRVDVEKHGMKRKVLSEEITKYLTLRYEFFKA
ncbi:uncharacterized protein LOC127698399 [Mytilus californianus]|uniref:uncharacterized protein LOC127698399 n=1 Tax=Mytilus californianus TaxID=6549 RepID=UPI0022462617|nr:uncharacterized protein LOC127698399 [Mytilus californianus]